MGISWLKKVAEKKTPKYKVFDLQKAKEQRAKIKNSKYLADLLSLRKAFGHVSDSDDLQRIKQLPKDLVEFIDLTPHVAKPGGTMVLRPVQSLALLEAAYANGLFAAMRVGAGKTLLSFLLPVAMDSKNPLLLVPPDLYDKTLRDLDFYSPHFEIPKLRIEKYSTLSIAKNQDLLWRIKPDLIIADEAHALARKEAARTKRFIAFMRENPDTRFAAMSGTMTKNKLQNFQHLLMLALKKNAPIPLHYDALKEWGNCLDADSRAPFGPGELEQLREDSDPPFKGTLNDRRTSAREVYGKRLRQTPGVVVTKQVFENVPLFVRPVCLQDGLPCEVQAEMDFLNQKWEVADEEITEILDKHRFEMQLSMGFYSIFDWPGEPDYDWLSARRNWAKEVREVLKFSRRGLDSPMLVERAAQRAIKLESEGREPGKDAVIWKSETYPAWLEQKHKPMPPTKVIWISDFMIHAIRRWTEMYDNGIIWVQHLPLATALSQLFPVYGQKTDAEKATENFIVCTVRTQSKGKNLQHRYCNNLLTSLSADAALFEQIVGRTHREGQEKPVRVDYMQHTSVLKRARERLQERAEYAEQIQGQPHKLLYAEHQQELEI